MAYINVGAYVGMQRPKTKKALREAMRDDPHNVIFEQTSLFTNEFPRSFTGNDLPAATLVVAGPDPERKRSWFANVSPAGKVS
jgi:hypothetical protein